MIIKEVHNQYYTKDGRLNIYPKQLEEVDVFRFSTNYQFIKEFNSGRSVTVAENPKFITSKIVKQLIREGDISLGRDSYGNEKYEVFSQHFLDSLDELNETNEESTQDLDTYNKMLIAAAPVIAQHILGVSDFNGVKNVFKKLTS